MPYYVYPFGIVLDQQCLLYTKIIFLQFFGEYMAVANGKTPDNS